MVAVGRPSLFCCEYEVRGSIVLGSRLWSKAGCWKGSPCGRCRTQINPTQHVSELARGKARIPAPGVRCSQETRRARETVGRVPLGGPLEEPGHSVPGCCVLCTFLADSQFERQLHLPGFLTDCEEHSPIANLLWKCHMYRKYIWMVLSPRNFWFVSTT